MAETRDFLLEIGTEEMPSAPLMNAQKQLGTIIERGMAETGLAHGAIRTLSTPRRLAVIVEACATATDEVHDVKRGPAAQIAFDADGAPTKAALGFARKCGVDAAALVRRVDTDGREYVFAEKTIPSAPALPLLSALSERTIASLEWPNYRSQRWGSEHAGFVRPIRWICALLGSEVVPVSYADVTSGSTTRGHRVLAPGDHAVPEASCYERVLEDAFVLGEKRRAEVIRAGIAAIEQERGGAHVDTPKRIFDEVVNLCEWPSVLVGTFDEQFLAVPHEIICESMLSNQRYFPVYAADGSLTREFVVVSNAAPGTEATVVDGNERVVRARLYDAKFFYDEDLRVPLDEYVERLSVVTFQEKLGTMRAKVSRMETLAGAVAELAGTDAETHREAVRAAHLAKGDLVSQAVVEFTNQQGVMGGYYAAAAGEPAAVCQAIREHYRPRFAGDELPEGIVGKAVAIADKLDTICGIFAIDEAPTGSSDPYAVRRATIGVISMLKELPSVSLAALIDTALASYADQGLAFDSADVAGKVCAFFAGRLAAIAKDEGIAADIIDAISAIGIIDPAEFLARARALADARANSPELFEDLSTAYTRAAHLCDASLGTDCDASLMTEPETALLAAIEHGRGAVADRLEAKDFAGAFTALAELREPIDRFFVEVLVMDEDTRVKENRLRLLNRFSGIFADVADIGCLSKK